MRDDVLAAEAKTAKQDKKRQRDEAQRKQCCTCPAKTQKEEATMTTPQTPRWYSVNNMGMATLCADKADAEDVARTCDMEWPRQGPHLAVQLVEASTLDTERTARLGLAHRKAVQEAVREALHEAKKACENLHAPESCSGVEKSLWDVATMACAEAVGKMGTPRHNNGEHDAI